MIKSLFVPLMFVGLLIIGFTACSARTERVAVPPPPQSLRNAPSVPEWWPDVTVNYSSSTSISNGWVRVKQLEALIEQNVREGISPVQERRELIKYLTPFSESTNLPAFSREMFKLKIADAYERLGDYRRAAWELLQIANGYPDGAIVLPSLALQYERLGEKESALQVYGYMARTLKDDRSAAYIAAAGIACLNGATNSCVLRKPEWWGQYQSPPDWWTNTAVTLPKFSCFEDGYDYIVDSLWRKEDPRKVLKARSLLAEFRPMTYDEKIRILLAIRGDYSYAGDHHRAVEAAWRIPEQFSGDSERSKIALKIIASEFEKLGEPEHAKEIRDMIPCFAGESGTK